MTLLIERLPEYKGLIIRCIDSCNTKEQLVVCWDFISLFQMRFQGWIDDGVYHNHINDLHQTYLTKSQRL